MENTLLVLPLAAATSLMYWVSRLVYEAVIRWPGGVQKMGVMTRGPVWAVPMTAPPCQINGGSPMAFWPALGLAASHAAVAGCAPMMPLRCPVRTGVLACVTQEAAACDE